MAGIFFLDFYESHVVERGFDGEVHVQDFGDSELDHGEEDAFDGFAHPSIFHGGLPNDGGGVDGVLAHGDGGDVEYGELPSEAVVASVVAEWTFELAFVGVDVAFDDEFTVGGDADIHGFAFDGMHSFAAEESGEEDFVDTGRKGGNGGEIIDGVSTETDGDFDALFLGTSFFHMAHSGFVHLPVHATGVFVMELDSVHADITLAGVGVVGEDEGKGDEGAAIFGPTGEDWEFGEVDIVAGEDDFLTERIFDGFGGSVFEFEELGEEFEGLGGALGDFWFEEGGNAFGVLFEVITAQGHGHAFSGAHGVDGDGVGVLDAASGTGLGIDARVVEHGGHGVGGSESVG